MKSNVFKQINIAKYNSFFDIKKIRYDLIQQSIIWQLINNRKIIASTKCTSEVRGSTRKIYKQKGTGRARHKSHRVGQFRGGAVIFGPSNKKRYFFKLNKKIRKKSLLHAILLKLNNNSMFIIKSININVCKTKSYFSAYGSSNRKILFINDSFDYKFYLSTKNLLNISLLKTINLNVLDLLRNDYIYISKNSFYSILDINNS